ncbi:MAG: 5-deoxy-glucuronate isomerase [Acutalibacteraceae bacterium]|nr:5-deoxy-glucuronate isomerase [Acutalibacteraceae bacterium]
MLYSGLNYKVKIGLVPIRRDVTPRPGIFNWEKAEERGVACVKNDELVEFPVGYHTTVSTPGYQTYFLWLMAGDYQGFNRSNDPEHDWIANR